MRRASYIATVIHATTALMSWSSIIGQRHVIEVLESSVASDRVAHAWLFFGPDGVGKRAVALEYAQTLLCEHGAPRACGTCRSCVKVSRMVHPDLHVLFPHPTDATPTEVAERIQLLGENPYAAVDFVRRPVLGSTSRPSNKQALYTVGRVHEEVRQALSYRSVEGRYKIAIMLDADLLRTDAANALLKVLEEPTPWTVFILTTSRPESLLLTVLSRCQRIRFEALSAATIEEALVDREGVEPAMAAPIARMANGSYTTALDLAQNEALHDLRRLVLDYLRMSWSGNITRLTDLIERMAGLGRDQVGYVLGLMLQWVRDLVLYRSLGEEAPLINVDQAKAVAKFVQHLPHADLEAMASMIEEAIGLVRRNVHVSLTLIVLSQSLGLAMRGSHGGCLYAPLCEDSLTVREEHA